MNIRGILREHLRIDLRRAGGVAFNQGRVGRLQKIELLAAKLALGQPFDECGDLAFGQRTEEAVGRLSVHERDDRGNRLNPHLPGDGRVFVDIHLAQLHFALGGPHQIFEERGELLARAAPRRPEIDQHRLLTRFVDHVLLETLGRRILDETIRGERRSAVLYHANSLKIRAEHSPGINGKAPIRLQLHPVLAVSGAVYCVIPSETSAMRGGWPVASRKRTKSSRPIDVVMVLTSGW